MHQIHQSSLLVATSYFFPLATFATFYENVAAAVAEVAVAEVAVAEVAVAVKPLVSNRVTKKWPKNCSELALVDLHFLAEHGTHPKNGFFPNH